MYVNVCSLLRFCEKLEIPYIKRTLVQILIRESLESSVPILASAQYLRSSKSCGEYFWYISEIYRDNNVTVISINPENPEKTFPQKYRNYVNPSMEKFLQARSSRRSRICILLLCDLWKASRTYIAGGGELPAISGRNASFRSSQPSVRENSTPWRTIGWRRSLLRPLALASRRTKIAPRPDGTLIPSVSGKVCLPHHEPFHGFRRKITGNFQERRHENCTPKRRVVPLLDYTQKTPDFPERLPHAATVDTRQSLRIHGPRMEG